MKKLLTIVLLLLSLIPAQAKDGDKVKVKMKSGTIIVGDLKSLDPTQNIVLKLAGVETTIPMSDVESVEMLPGSSNNSSVTTTSVVKPNQQVLNGDLGSNKLIVTETKSFPDRITIKIDNIPHEMILVPGGRMRMGYDGSGSLSMKSEPIHEVIVTSFYISATPLPASFVTGIVGTKYVDGYGDEPAEVKVFKDVEKLLPVIVSRSGYNLRLPTEAEWEYAACSDQQNRIFAIAKGVKIAYDWCSDFWATFERCRDKEIDPTGPYSGKEHVVRAYNARKGKFDRSNEVSGRCYQGLVRLAIKAVDIK